MAKSKSVKFNVTHMTIETGVGASAKSITSLTAANPAVMTVAADTTLKTGDCVLISGGTVADGRYVVKETGVDSTKFELVGLDLTGSTATFSSAKYAKLTMEYFCDVTSQDVNFGSKDYKDVTTNCDDYPQEEGEVKPGDIKLGIVSNIDNPLQQKIEAYFKSDAPLMVQFRPQSLTTLRSWVVSVASYSYSAQVNEKYKGEVSLKMKSHNMDVIVTI